MILSTTDVGRTTHLILDADPAYLLAGLAFVALEVAVRSLAWWMLAGAYAGGYGYPDAAATYLIGIAFGAVTPGKAGDFVKTADLRDRTGLKLTKALTVGLLDRMVNFMFLFFSAGAAAAAVALVFSGVGGGLWNILVLVAAVMTVFAVVLSERLSSAILGPLQAFLVPVKYRQDTNRFLKTFYETVGEFRRSGRMLPVLALTLAGWAVIFVRPYFFGQALGIGVSWWMFLVFTPVITLVEVLPLSVLGLGTRDASIIFLFGLMGVDREVMVALSAIILLLSLVPQVIAGYLIACTRKVRVKNEGAFS